MQPPPMVPTFFLPIAPSTNELQFLCASFSDVSLVPTRTNLDLTAVPEPAGTMDVV